jgi:hypothetical protein
MKVLGLNDPQMAELLAAARTLPCERRDAFIQAVFAYLSGIRRTPTNGDVAAAIAETISDASTPMFLCDSANPKDPDK